MQIKFEVSTANVIMPLCRKYQQSPKRVLEQLIKSPEFESLFIAAVERIENVANKAK